MFRADDHFVLDAHSHAVKVFGELRIGRDVDTFLLTWRSRRQHGDDDTKHRRGGHRQGSHTRLDGDDHPFLQSIQKLHGRGQREWIKRLLNAHGALLSTVPDSCKSISP